MKRLPSSTRDIRIALLPTGREASLVQPLQPPTHKRDVLRRYILHCVPTLAPRRGHLQKAYLLPVLYVPYSLDRSWSKCSRMCWRYVFYSQRAYLLRA